MRWCSLQCNKVLLLVWLTLILHTHTHALEAKYKRLSRRASEAVAVRRGGIIGGRCDPAIEREKTQAGIKRESHTI